MAEQSTAQTKVCSKCGEEKTLDQFHRRSSAKDGRRELCAKCATAMQNKRYDPDKYKQYRETVKEKLDQGHRDWYSKNKEKCAERYKRYYEANKKTIIANKREKHKENQRRLRKDPSFRIVQAMRGRLSRILKGKPGALRHVDFSPDELIRHLERQFTKKMTLENYGSYWHVDHIIPVSAFNQEDESDFKACWSLSNLRPLEAKKNMSKGARVMTLI